MVRKGVAVWVLGALTFLAGLHVLDGFLWLTGSQSRSLFLSINPFTNFIGGIDPNLYLILSFTSVFFLWGGTILIALRNPIETFLGKVLEDGKKENQADVEFLEAKTSILEMMSETLESNSKSLSGLRDIVFNVRSEVLRFSQLNENVDLLKNDLEYLKKMMKKLEFELKKRKICPACGKEVMVEFRLCPYCGENLLKPTSTNRAMLLSAPSIKIHNKK